jgi:uncharacterized membrane protein
MYKIHYRSGLTRLLVFAFALLVPCLVAGYMMNPPTGLIAVGNNPDWRLEVIFSSQAMKLSINDDIVVHHYTRLGPTLHNDIKTTVYRMHSSDHYMQVIFEEKFCQDSQTGKAYGATVSVRLDGAVYTGCGMEIAPPFEED